MGYRDPVSSLFLLLTVTLRQISIHCLTLWAGGVLEVVLVLDVGHAQVGLHLESEGGPVRDQLGPRVVVEHHRVLVQLVPFLSVGSLDAHLEAFWGYF